MMKADPDVALAAQLSQMDQQANLLFIFYFPDGLRGSNTSHDPGEPCYMSEKPFVGKNA